MFALLAVVGANLCCGCKGLNGVDMVVFSTGECSLECCKSVSPGYIWFNEYPLSVCAEPGRRAQHAACNAGEAALALAALPSRSEEAAPCKQDAEMCESDDECCTGDCTSIGQCIRPDRPDPTEAIDEAIELASSECSKEGDQCAGDVHALDCCSGLVCIDDARYGGNYASCVRPDPTEAIDEAIELASSECSKEGDQCAGDVHALDCCSGLACVKYFDPTDSLVHASCDPVRPDPVDRAAGKPQEFVLV